MVNRRTRKQEEHPVLMDRKAFDFFVELLRFPLESSCALHDGNAIDVDGLSHQSVFARLGECTASAMRFATDRSAVKTAEKLQAAYEASACRELDVSALLTLLNACCRKLAKDIADGRLTRRQLLAKQPKKR